MSDARVRVAQRGHHVVALVKQLQVPQSAFVHLPYPIQMSLNKMRPFYRLDDGRSSLTVRGLQVFQIQRAAYVSLFQLRVDRGEPAQVVLSRIARLLIGRKVQNETRTDGGKPGSLDLFRNEKLRPLRLLVLPRRRTSLRAASRPRTSLRTMLRMRFCPLRIDMVMHVDANGLRHDL